MESASRGWTKRARVCSTSRAARVSGVMQLWHTVHRGRSVVPPAALHNDSQSSAPPPQKKHSTHGGPAAAVVPCPCVLVNVPCALRVCCSLCVCACLQLVGRKVGGKDVDELNAVGTTMAKVADVLLNAAAGLLSAPNAAQVRVCVCVCWYTCACCWLLKAGLHPLEIWTALSSLLPTTHRYICPPAC